MAADQTGDSASLRGGAAAPAAQASTEVSAGKIYTQRQISEFKLQLVNALNKLQPGLGDGDIDETIGKQSFTEFASAKGIAKPTDFSTLEFETDAKNIPRTGDAANYLAASRAYRQYAIAKSTSEPQHRLGEKYLDAAITAAIYLTPGESTDKKYQGRAELLAGGRFAGRGYGQLKFAEKKHTPEVERIINAFRDVKDNDNDALTRFLNEEYERRSGLLAQNGIREVGPGTFQVEIVRGGLSLISSERQVHAQKSAARVLAVSAHIGQTVDYTPPSMLTPGAKAHLVEAIAAQTLNAMLERPYGTKPPMANISPPGLLGKYEKVVKKAMRIIYEHRQNLENFANEGELLKGLPTGDGEGEDKFSTQDIALLIDLGVKDFESYTVNADQDLQAGAEATFETRGAIANLTYDGPGSRLRGDLSQNLDTVAAALEESQGPRAQPGAQPGAEPGAQPGAEPGAQPGAEPDYEPPTQGI